MNILTRATLALAIGMSAACNSLQTPEPNALTSGVIADNFNTNVRPQDDFFNYVNGSWIERTQIPSDKSSYGAFAAMHEDAQADVRAIIEQSSATAAEPGTPDALIATMYASFMDEERANQLGIKPLQSELAAIQAIETTEDLFAHFAWRETMNIRSPLAIGISEDYKDPTRYIGYLHQSGLGLPNSDYYSDDSEPGVEIVTAYKAYLQALLQHLDYSEDDASAAAQRIYALEQELASHHRPPKQNREYSQWYNLRGAGEQPLPQGLPWSAFLTPFGLSEQQVLALSQPEYAQGLVKVVSNNSIALWREYLQVHLLSSSAPYLDQDLQDLNFNFYGATLYGTPAQRPRWKRGVSLVNKSVGDAVGQVYVREHFPAQAKQRMDELVANLQIAYGESIAELDWMGPETREKALAKLASFTPNIGYPDEWKNYSSMKLGNDLVANVRAAARWETQRQVDKLQNPVNPREWFMTPQTVNAYYYPLQNSITFPAAILKPPFFGLGTDDAVNYGAIGSVIGHEIGHGFDDNGSQFDGEGRLQSWWTEDDRAAFEDLTAELVEQYDTYEVLPGVFVDGTLTQGENIGDLAGVSIAYRAYINSLGGKPAPVIDGFTGEQRFFIGFAQAFQSKSRDERLEQQVKTDTHSPEKIRVNGTVTNVPGFYEAFNLQAGDALYSAPEQRVKIW
jgi:putative endopeptidase